MENCSGRGLACRLGRCFCLRQRSPPGIRNPWATFFAQTPRRGRIRSPAAVSFNPTAVSLSTQPAWFAASAATTPSLELLTLDETRTAVSLSFGRKKEKVRRKGKESLSLKKASRFGYGEERKRRSCDAKDCFRFHVSCHMLGVLLRLPRQSASAQNADGSALHFHRPCLVSNPAGISQKMHVPIKCCARPCGEGKRVVVPNAVFAVACNHKAPRSGRLAVTLPRRHFQLSILQSPFSSSLKIFLPFPQQYAKIYYSMI